MAIVFYDNDITVARHFQESLMISFKHNPCSKAEGHHTRQCLANSGYKVSLSLVKPFGRRKQTYLRPSFIKINW